MVLNNSHQQSAAVNDDHQFLKKHTRKEAKIFKPFLCDTSTIALLLPNYLRKMFLYAQLIRLSFDEIREVSQLRSELHEKKSSRMNAKGHPIFYPEKILLVQFFASRLNYLL